MILADTTSAIERAREGAIEFLAQVSLNLKQAKTRIVYTGDAS